VSLVFGILVLGGLALAPCLQARHRDVGLVVLGVLVAFGAQELTKVVFGESGSPALAAAVLGIVGGLTARLPGRNAATVVIPGLLQLAPGFLGSGAVLHSLGTTSSTADSSKTFFDVLLVSLQLVTGLLIGGLAVPSRRT
jgi:uncharacterized membrane protein YjjB (DUF3815 family)